MCKKDANFIRNFIIMVIYVELYYKEKIFISCNYHKLNIKA